MATRKKKIIPMMSEDDTSDDELDAIDAHDEDYDPTQEKAQKPRKRAIKANKTGGMQQKSEGKAKDKVTTGRKASTSAKATFGGKATTIAQANFSAEVSNAEGHDVEGDDVDNVEGDDVESDNAMMERKSPVKRKTGAKRKATVGDVSGKLSSAKRRTGAKLKAVFDVDDEEDEEQSPSRQRARSAVKKTAIRKSTKEQVLTCGEPSHPQTFANIDTEATLTRYLGYEDAVDLRRFACSWPSVKALSAFWPIALNLQKLSSYRLIADCEEKLKTMSQDDLDEHYPLDARGGPVAKTKNWRLAHLLLDYEMDVKVMAGNTPGLNMKMARFYANNRDEGFKLFPLFADTYKDIRIPVLGPILQLQESRLEAINRLWCAMRYMRHIIQGGKAVWVSKFTAEVLKRKILVPLQYMLMWMQPSATDDDAELPIIGIHPDVLRADEMAKKSFQIMWDRHANVADKAEIEEHLDTLNQMLLLNANIWTTLQQDPRLCKDIFGFRDLLRRQFNFQELGLDIQGILLKFKRDGQEMLSNPNEEDWSLSKSTFGDASNDDFQFRLFVKLAEGPSIYESFEPPPAIPHLVTVTSGDVDIAGGAGLSIVARAANPDGALSPTAATDKPLAINAITTPVRITPVNPLDPSEIFFSDTTANSVPTALKAKDKEPDLYKFHSD